VTGPVEVHRAPGPSGVLVEDGEVAPTWLRGRRRQVWRWPGEASNDVPRPLASNILEAGFEDADEYYAAMAEGRVRR